jgi:biotin carboxyl carrier protein
MEKEVSSYIALTPKGKKFEIEISDDQIRFKKKLLDVSIEEGKDGFTYIIHDNKRYPVEIVSVNQNKFEVMINNVSYFFSVETPISVKRKELLKKQTPESKTFQIVSPMPGKIIEVFVEEGGAIVEGDALLVLEAMKMQNEITSHASGKIKKVFAKPGDIVNKDDLLIEIER